MPAPALEAPRVSFQRREQLQMEHRGESGDWAGRRGHAASQRRWRHFSFVKSHLPQSPQTISRQQVQMRAVVQVLKGRMGRGAGCEGGKTSLR